MKEVIVIPAYEEETTIGDVVQAALEVCDQVVVVDDGSTDSTSTKARLAGAVVCRHAINRGLGGALGTGLEAAIILGADTIVTMDADGQHRAQDARRVLDRLAAGDVDFVIGTRLRVREGNMPRTRHLANLIANALTWLLFGTWVSDSQSGLRGLTRRAALKVELRTNGMEVSSEFIKQIRHQRWRWTEIDIPAIYSDYSLHKGQSFTVGLRTAGKLLLRKLIG